MTRILTVVFAFVSIFWFPWFVSVFALVIAEGYVPGSALVLGFFADLLNRSSSGLFHPFPIGTFAGIVIGIFLFVLRRLFHHRLIGSVDAEQPVHFRSLV